MPPAPPKAPLQAVDHVVVWVRDPAKAEEFYRDALGLKVVERAPATGWLAVQPRGGGTKLALLVPDPGEAGYAEAKAQIGGNTGVAFVTSDLKATLGALKASGAAIPWATLDPAAAGGLHATVEDPDGNLLMLFQPHAKAAGKPGLDRVGFVNVVVRDLRAAKDFYGPSLGLAAGEELETQAWVEFKAAEGAAIGLLQPVEETYQDPEAYTADMAHIGEATGIAFRAADLDAAVAELRARGVVFPRPPSADAGGERRAVFADPDGNTFTLLAAPRRAAAKPKARAPAAKRKPAPTKAKPGPKAKARAKPAKAAAKKRR